MKISVFGLGYVGSVSAACLARDGHHVVGVDVNPMKVDQIASGTAPVLEPGLPEIISQAVKAGRLTAVGDTAAAIRDTSVSIVCVGTPSNANGSLRLDYVENVCREIGEALGDKNEYHVVVVRSTVLPGTVRKIVTRTLAESSGRRVGSEFGVCMNPEFLRESTAIKDYDDPCLIVIGEYDERSGDAVEEMYRSIGAPVVRTTLETAEMVKYVNNAYHAVKIAFANEVGNLCQTHGVDGRDVMEIFCRDDRLNISPAYLKPGFAFGGSCLPKDLRALLYRAKERDVESPLLNSILLSNQRQIERGIEMVEKLGRKKIGVVGLSFKAGTDDVRESPTVPLVETLVGRGYDVSVYDEYVHPERLIGANKAFLEQELPHIASLITPSLEQLVEGAEVVVVTNGGKPYQRAPSLMRDGQHLVDLVGISDAEESSSEKCTYHGICW